MGLTTAQLIEELDKTASELEREALTFDDNTKTASVNTEVTSGYFESLSKTLGL